MWSSYSNQRIYLDSNIIIYAIERNHSWARTAKSLLDAIEDRVFLAIASELAVAEVLSKPLAVGNQNLVRKYEQVFADDIGLKMFPIDRNVLLQAAHLRGRLKLKLFDAIHVATARQAGCDHFLTQDERLGRALAGEPKWLKLSEIN